MTVWIVEFSNEGIKLERFLPKNQWKSLNFENWATEVFKNQSFKSQLFSSSQKKIPQIKIMA